ncbi:MAG TPA: MopE-related protein [bacterium]|nr:MopE-related protein [bacterium]
MKLFSFFVGVLGVVLVIGCSPTEDGEPYIGVGEPCSGDGTICSSDGELLLKCSAGALILQESCVALSKDCKNGACVERSEPGDACTGTGSICSGDKILSCQEDKYVETFNCASEDKDCKEEDGAAVCVEKPKVDNTPTTDSDEPVIVDETGDNEPVDEDQVGGQCTPGETEECYHGPSNSKGVGPCKSGMATCAASGNWGPCEGEVLPTMEICLDGIDQNCDGKDETPETAEDIDGDGITVCQGDCCEIVADCPGADPKFVTPEGAEILGNGVDDDCNGHQDEVVSCDNGLTVSADTPSSAIALAKAIGICDPWLVSAELGLAGPPATEYIADGPEGSSKINRPSLEKPYFDDQYQTYAVPPMFGSVLTAKEGMAMSILSTGPWDRPTGDAANATLAAGDMKTASGVPMDWLNRQPNCAAPKAPSCPGGVPPDPTIENSCAGKPDFVVQDPIMLTVKVKVPINALAFKMNSYFCSIEYPNTVCSSENYNDFFITLLDSTYNTVNPTATNPNPVDKNLAKDDKGNPVGVDLAPAGLFKVCNQACGNALSNTNPYGACTGDAELAGTGFGSQTIMGICSGNGCTGWLTTQGNVVPGEEITLRFAIFEQGTVAYGPDHSWDSTVLLDNFQWLLKEVKPGTGMQE